MAQVVQAFNTAPAGQLSLDSHLPWQAFILDKSGKSNEMVGVQIGTTKLEIYTNIDEMYVTVDWIFGANSNLIDKYKLNDISIGSLIYFTFYPPSLADPQGITMAFGVLSIVNGGGFTTTTLGSQYELILVSPWYFQQYIDSHCYYGSVSSIVSSMMKNDFVKGTFTEFRVHTSDDPPAPRWRTMMKQGEFIMKRLKKYYRGTKNSSSFIFTNTDNALEIISYADMVKSNPILAISMSSTHLPAFKEFITSAQTVNRVIYPTSVFLSINNGPKRNLWDLAMPTMAYMYKNGYMKTYIDKPNLSPLGYDNTSKFTFVNTSKNDNFTKIYMEETLHDPDDIFNMVNNEHNKDLQQAHHLTMVCNPNITLLAGRIGSFYLTQDDGSPSVFAQNYIIKEVTHIIEGMIGRTEVVFEATSFDSSLIKDTSGLFHMNNVPIPATPTA